MNYCARHLLRPFVILYESTIQHLLPITHMYDRRGQNTKIYQTLVILRNSCATKLGYYWLGMLRGQYFNNILFLFLKDTYVAPRSMLRDNLLAFMCPLKLYFAHLFRQHRTTQHFSNAYFSFIKYNSYIVNVLLRISPNFGKFFANVQYISCSSSRLTNSAKF